MPKLFFPGGMEGVQNSSGNSGGVGGYFSSQKLEILGRRGGAYVKFPLWWGYGYFLELHIESLIFMYKCISCTIIEEITRTETIETFWALHP